MKCKLTLHRVVGSESNFDAEVGDMTEMLIALHQELRHTNRLVGTIDINSHGLLDAYRHQRLWKALYGD